MNDNEANPTPVSDLVMLLDSIFPERSALSAENMVHRDQAQRVAGLIQILKWIGLIPFFLQIAVMTIQIASDLRLRDIDPLLLGSGLLLLIAAHYIEQIFGSWRLNGRGQYDFIPVMGSQG